jgi:glycosyltransferase involved in cell wall biosynthesis
VKLEILVLTQPSRKEYLKRLRANIVPQLTPEVSIQYRLFDPMMSLGANRQAMYEAADAEFVASIDDDDLVAPDYISTILPLLDRDYVGFRVQCYMDGVPFSKTYHSLRYDRWWNDEHGYYRHISHLNPIRRELALLEPMEGGVGEDHRWADRLYATGKVRTEHFIDRVMYHYYSRSVKNDAAFRWEPPASSSL